MSLKTFYCEVTLSANGDKWVCTAIQNKATVSASVAWLNKTAEVRKLGSTYKAVSRDDYLAYRAKVRELIESGQPTPPPRPLIQAP